MKIYTLLALLLLTSCSSRNSLKPEEALLGHWRSEDQKIDLYFSRTQRIMVTEAGSVGPLGYSKRSVLDGERKISILYHNPSFVETYTLNEDRKEMLQDANGIGSLMLTEARRWYYVDDKQAP